MKPRTAFAITYHFEHGCLCLNLLSKAGVVFAQALVPDDGALDLADVIYDVLVPEHDSIGEVQGHA